MTTAAASRFAQLTRGKGTSASVLMALAALAPTSALAAEACSSPVAVQMLGTGGPIAEGARAGSSAIVWLDGKAAVLVDAGSGAFLRYGEAGIRFEDHRAILLTHFHADHVADLPAILNSGSFTDRTEPLVIMGPAGSADFPGLRDYLRTMFDPHTGAFRYMSGYLDGKDGRAMLAPVEVDPHGTSSPFAGPATNIRITPIGVEHGVVPALGYLIEAGGKTIVFAGDQSAASDAFIDALNGRTPDILVVHNVIPEGAGQPIGLHRPPSSIGVMAAAIRPKLLVLAHNMQRALARETEGETAIRKSYHGPLVVADDLSCFAL